MEEKLKAYVYSLFKGAPRSKKMIEVREEICSNTLERYRDLISTGASEEEAYDISVRSIGNLDELLDGLAYDDAEQESVGTVTASDKKRAAGTGVSVALYILSPVFLIGFAVAGEPIIGLIIMLVLVAVATGLLIYVRSVYPSYEARASHYHTEAEIKAWKDMHDYSKKADEHNKNPYSPVIWLTCTVIFFALGFGGHAWGICWIVFLIGAAVQALVNAIMSKDN